MKGRSERTRAEERAVRSRIPAPAAGLFSLAVPGLGQILTGQFHRGLLLFGSFFSMALIAAWRIFGLAHREEGPLAIIGRAAGRRPLFVGLLVASLVLLWLWIALDAWLSVRQRRRRGSGIFLVVLLGFFTLGWQISEINLYKMVTEFSDAWPPLSRVLWPWEAAFTYSTDTLSAEYPIRIGCDGDLPEPPPEVPDQPQLAVEPKCGELSTVDADNRPIAGTLLTIRGEGFAPNTETQLWWQDPIGNEFRLRSGGGYVSLTTDQEGSFTIRIPMPYRMVPPSAVGPQIHRVAARQISRAGGPIPSEPLRLTIGRMMETIFMGMMATIFGIIFSIPISFLAARNLMAGSWLTMTLYYVTRTLLNIIRSIEPLIWALIAVVWVGLGPFAGIVALTIHSIASLGKLYSEAIEGIDPGPIEAIHATGANRLQTIMYAVVPQMISPFVAFSIYRWDINVRMSTVIGLVGGGGIGFLLVQYIRLLDYRAAGIAVWFIAITVGILDYVSAEIRAKYV